MRYLTAAFALLFSATVLIAEEIGSVSTVFKLLAQTTKSSSKPSTIQKWTE